MSRPTPTPIELAAKDVERSRKEVAKREHELAAARVSEDDTKLTYDASGDDGDLESASKARLRRERCERVLASAREALARAEDVQRQVLREDMASVFEGERVALSSWAATLDVAALVHLDRLVEAAVVAIAARVAEAMALHAQAAGHARELGRMGDLPAAPDLASARLLVQQALAADRAQREGEDLSQWMQSASSRWQDRGLSAADVEASRAYGERQRQAAAAAAQASRGMQIAAVTGAAALAHANPNRGA
jgi:hypothetical protein